MKNEITDGSLSRYIKIEPLTVESLLSLRLFGLIEWPTFVEKYCEMMDEKATKEETERSAA